MKCVPERFFQWVARWPRVRAAVLEETELLIDSRAGELMRVNLLQLEYLSQLHPVDLSPMGDVNLMIFKTGNRVVSVYG